MKLVPTWKAEPYHLRLMNCVRMLAIHQMLTERERDKAIYRIKKDYTKSNKQEEPT